MDTTFPGLLASYLTVHLPARMGYSPNTVASYRDVFVLFLRYLDTEEHVPPDRAGWDNFTPPVIEAFLGWLETRRGCSAATRNQRLAGINAFLKYAQAEAPELIAMAAPIISIKPKKTIQPKLAYLSVDAIRLILAQAKQAGGTRDVALLALLYDTGARVQEIADLTTADLRLDKPATATLTGKGGKTRTVPITPQAAALVARHLRTTQPAPTDRVFTNRAGRPITRAGIAWILQHHTSIVSAQHPGLTPEKVTPHMVRHSKAMHLLEHGVNLVYIRDFLGHASVTTTEVYAKANPEMKRKAIDAASANIITETSYDQPTRNSLLEWLHTIL